MKITTILLIFFSFAFVQINAQNKTRNPNMANGKGIIAGIVKDSASKTAMAYVTITLSDAKSNKIIDGMITKSMGEFAFNGLPNGAYKLKCSFMGYQTENFDELIISEKNHIIDFGAIFLKAKSVTLGNVEKVEDRPIIAYMLDKKVVNISDNPNAQGGRLSDALQNIPSVSVDMEGNVSIRGSGNFQVLIDGRPSPMPGNDVLKSIPSDAVENIELITNPSAKYDPDGTAGIINIVLKKASLNGMNGLVNITGGIKDKYSCSGIFNYRYDDFNFYSGVDYHSMTFKPYSNFTRESYYQSVDTVRFINPSIDRTMKDKSLTLKGGIEYSLSDNQFITISGNVHKGDFTRIMPTKMSEWDTPNSFYKFFFNNDEYTVNGYYSTANLYYLNKFNDNGHQISSTLNAIFWDGGGDELISIAESDRDYKTKNILKENRTNADSKTIMSKFKTDYVLPISDAYKLEAGYNFDYTQDFSDFLYESLNLSTRIWEKNSEFTNNTKYYHTINALYATFAGSVFDFNYQVGLRGEYFNRRLNQVANNLSYNYDKFNFFPTAHISRNFENDQQIQISYSRRVQRPDVYALNPFPDYVDDNIVSIGNPNLMPEFTDSYELNYQKGFQSLFLSLQTYYRETDNAISRVLKVNSDKKLWITSENVASNYALGAEFSANINLSKSFRFNLNGNLYNYKFKSNENDVEGDKGGTVFDGNIMAYYSFSPSTLAQLNFFYIGPKYTIDGKVKETYSVGFSVRQFLLDRKLTLFLNGRNILNTVKYESENRRKDFYSYGRFETEGANISIGISLNINNYEQKIRPEDQIEKTNVGGSGGY